MQDPPFLTVKKYLATEEASDVRHEYLAGIFYAMAGASEAHNRIASNLGAMLHRNFAVKRARSLALICECG